MRTVTITVGTQIDTEDGMYTVKSINEAGLCFCDEYICNDDGYLVKIDANAMLTASDISRKIRPLIGSNKVIVER